MTVPVDQEHKKQCCPLIKEWLAFRTGKLPTENVDALTAHLEHCSRCREMLDALRQADDALRFALPPPNDNSIDIPHGLSEPEQAGLSSNAAEETASNADSSSATPHLGRLSAGKRLGRYVLHEELGHGGMGQVFKANHDLTRRTVAIKVIAGRHVGSGLEVQRFRREIAAQAQLDHPHIVRVWHADQEDDLLYLVMEYVEGKTLSQVVREHGPLPVTAACRYVQQTADALQHAHERGLIHRDIKPSNLMLVESTREVDTAFGRIKLLDLGLALLREDSSAPSELTATGHILGTPEYMAPEQWDDTHHVDIRADLYSLGCTLFNLLAGQPPFPRSEYTTQSQLWKAHLQEEVPDLQVLRPDLPPALAEVVYRLLAKDPAERFATPAELRDALQPFITQEPVATEHWENPDRELGAADTLTAKRRRRFFGALRYKGVFLAAAMVVIVFALVVVSWQLGIFSFRGLDNQQQDMSAYISKKKQNNLPITVRVEDCRLLHYRALGEKLVNQGNLCQPGFASYPREKDEVMFSVELNRPAYFYLLAYLPNGKEYLCYPEKDDVPPRSQRQFIYPSEEVGWILEEGAGSMAFVLLISCKALPAFVVWKQKNGAPPWGKHAASDGVWVGDKTLIHMLSSDSRAPSRQKKGPPPEIKSLYHYFKQCPEMDALQVVVFPVVDQE